MTKKKLTAVGAHVYAGGFTLGVREHFDVLAHFEHSKFGAETVTKNLGIPIHLYDEDGWPTSNYFPIDFVYCNPPCAAWSQANPTNIDRWHKDERLQFHDACFDLISSMQPHVFAMESVRGMYTKGKSLVMDMVMKARNMGYAPYFLLVDSKYHGTPQNRKRFFLVLSRVEISWQQTNKYPITAGSVWDQRNQYTDDATPNLNGKQRWHTILDKVEPGEQMRKAFDREFPELIGQTGVSGRGSMMLRKLDLDDQAQTFTGDCKTIHPTENRLLTAGEAALLSGFPPDYEFHGSVGGKFNQIARGVLPKVGEYVGHQVERAIRRAWHPATYDPREITVYSDSVDERIV